jgi:F420H(2)-dependent quinone reductase
MHRLAIRLSGGRLGVAAPRHEGMGMLILTTVGRRSGTRRETPLYFMPDGERLVLVASNAGGANHPAWWLNLKASGRAEVRTPAGSATVRAREAGEEERERLWPELVRRNPSFANYADRTGRHIPVVILEPI